MGKIHNICGFDDKADILEVSARLHKLRKNKGLTLAQVADAIGVHHCSVAGYESGRRYPSKKVSYKLAEFYGVEWKEIFEK